MKWQISYDHRTSQAVVGAQLNAAHNRQLAGVERRVVGIQRFKVLAVARPHHPDGSDAETDKIAVGVRRVALEVAIERAVTLGYRQFVIRFGEVVHADVHVPRRSQPLNGVLQDGELLLRRRQGRSIYPALGLEQLRQMRVVEHRQPVRPRGDDLVERARKTFHRLVRQAVDEVHVDGTETKRARIVQHRKGLALALNAVYGLLHPRVEVLHAHGQAIKTKLAQKRERPRLDFARVHLNAVFALVVVVQTEMRARDTHQFAHLVVRQERRRAAAPVQLIHAPRLVKQRALERDLPVQARQIRRRALAVAGDDFVAGAVIADRVAERDVEIEIGRASCRERV